MWYVAATGDAISEPRIMPFILWTHRPAAGDSSVLQEFLLWHFPRGSLPIYATRRAKPFKIELRDTFWWSCSLSALSDSLPVQVNRIRIDTQCCKLPPPSLVLCFSTFSSCSCVAATRSTRWVPHTTSSLPMWAQWKMLTGWVKPFFSYFIQLRNIFIRLHGWLPYSLFPVLKLKQQRDDSELPAWKMEVSSKLTKNFNSGLLIKWANLKGPNLPDLQFWSFLSICMTS